MNYNLDDFLDIKDSSSEERELTNLTIISKDLYSHLNFLKKGGSTNFYDELIAKIRSLIYNYVLEQQNIICSPIQKYLFLLYHLYQKLLDISFLNKKFLMNFLFKRIFLFFDSIHMNEYNNIIIINDSILNLCKDKTEPIIIHFLNLIINKCIFDSNSSLKDLEYLLKYFQDNNTYLQFSRIKKQMPENFFVQLICLDNFKNNDKLINFNDEKIAQNFIENTITKYYDLSANYQKEESEDKNNKILNDDEKENPMIFLFVNDFNVSNIHLIRYLRNAIINVFTPIDSNILDYFENYINKYLNKDKYNKDKNGFNFELLEKLFLNNNIQDVDMKIRNISFLIDIIIQKYFNIQKIQEFDLLKFPRINIIINRLFMEKSVFYESDKKGFINAIFEHFIISQFIFNYIKYQIKDPEHYPLEIRYFIIYSYLKISQDYLITNPFSAYITCIALREIINCLNFEKGFKKQKYIKNSKANIDISNNNKEISNNKNSTKKSKRRRSISKSKKKKKKAKKKSDQRSDTSKEKIDIDTELLENYIKIENDSKNESKTKTKDKIVIDLEKFDEPQKLISKTLFNYLCLVYSMETKYKEYSTYFEELYSFIDIYIFEHINALTLDDNWTWLLIYSINYIKNFDLKYSFDKFKLNINNNIDLDTKIELISNLSKKIKYCNTQEQFLILDVIYNILINENDLNTVIKLKKYEKKMKNLNRCLSYLSFNINYSVNLSKNMSFIDQQLVADRLFKITNLLFIESIDEYFWIPNNFTGYKNFNEFISILEKLLNKILYKKSVYTEISIYSVFKIKKYIDKFISHKNPSKKQKEKEQYILALDYFCKLEIPNYNNIQNIRDMSLTKEKIYKLMELMPEDYDLKLDMNEKVDLLSSILLSGEYDLRIILFLICQIINKKLLKDNSDEINLINEIFALMINKEYKFMINFILTLYKSLEKYQADLINEYVTIKFPENKNISKKEYMKYLDYFNSQKEVADNNEEGKEIQKIYHNWKLIRKKMEKSGVFYKFLSRAEEVNYPKSVMNLIEKYIFDITREKNIHSFTIENNSKNENEIKNIINYLKLYYKAYSHIDDNNIIFDNYFNNIQIFSLINKKNSYNNSSDFYLDINNNPINLNDFISNMNHFLINLDNNIILNNISLIGENEEKTNKNNHIYFLICRFFYNIIILNDKYIEINQRKFIYSTLKNMERNAILKILSYNNKLYDANNSMNYSLLLYELSLYFEQYKSLFNTYDNKDFNNINNILSKQLNFIFIIKRKVPHLKRYLLVFQFRRFLFNLYNDSISELYCLMDICKVYKTIWQTGISEEEISDFRRYILIYLNNLINIDEKLLANVNKKLFLIPLKYFVKYFSSEKCPQFDFVFQKYRQLCIKYKKIEFYSNKIIILPEKKRFKTGVVGLNDDLLKKIKKLGEKSSKNNKEGYLLYTDFYLEILISDENKFKVIKSDENIINIQIYNINSEIFDYLEGAIDICAITDKEKYLRKYMPEIINLFFKINFAHINYINNKNSQTQSQSQSLSEEKINKFIYLLNKFKKEVEINKIKIIIPQLIICYQYEKTFLYSFAVELLTSYAEENIDLIAYLLASFLTFKTENLKNIGIKPYRGRNDLYENKYRNFINTFSRSRNFVSLIKHKLSEKNQKILIGYEEFCEKLSNFFSETKRISTSSKKESNIKQNMLIKDINNILANYKIILPTIENINNYKSEIRNIENNDINDNILFFKELDNNIEVLPSKEKPMHIKFKVTNMKGDINPKNNYDFLLKCDINDITKEIKTFEIIDEINNIFRIKHYDINDSMSLKRYLIVPIAPTIILAEWLSDSISLSSVIDEQSKKDIVFQDENKSIIKYENNNKATIIPGSIINEEEKFNILYNYYQYNFIDPNLWYNAKKKYIISTAIWSMTSFLVGLGDRHPGNIMINKNTGEIIHIDFGYVALKGLSLGVPEIVDFRLTINLRKNLGLFEENGLFNYICVKALKAFKEYYKTLSARIEYYQFDPLFDSESDTHTFTLFNQNDEFFKYLDDKNVKDKLKELVVKNTNGENLEKMYIWWSPWI